MLYFLNIVQQVGVWRKKTSVDKVVILNPCKSLMEKSQKQLVNYKIPKQEALN